MQTVSLQEVITRIDAGEVFDVEICTADTTKGTGGRLVAFSRVVKHTRQQIPERERKKTVAEIEKAKVDPKHNLHFTRNIYLQDIREIRKIHLLLITLFNGKRVL
jgi:hypothetical protein